MSITHRSCYYKVHFLSDLYLCTIRTIGQSFVLLVLICSFLNEWSTSCKCVYYMIFDISLWFNFRHFHLQRKPKKNIPCTCRSVYCVNRATELLSFTSSYISQYFRRLVAWDSGVDIFCLFITYALFQVYSIVIDNTTSLVLIVSKYYALANINRRR
jgi:hypothetical protein